MNTAATAMAYIPAHDKTADECHAEIERLTRINVRLLEVIKDPATRTSQRDAALNERYLNRDYIKRLEGRLSNLEAPAP